MKRSKVITLVLLAAVSIFIPATNTIFAESDNGNPAVARLNFQVRIAQVLHLRIGSPGGTIDTVGFDDGDRGGRVGRSRPGKFFSNAATSPSISALCAAFALVSAFSRSPIAPDRSPFWRFARPRFAIAIGLTLSAG